jgi:hypothetical protein
MKVHKKLGGGVPFARKEPYEYDKVAYEADLKNGDVVTILDGGVLESGQWGEQNNFKIKTRNGDKKVSFNQKTINVLVDSFGDETENWVNKDVNVILQKALVAGEKRIIAYFVTAGWSLDEYGELVKEGSQESVDTVTEDVVW